MVANIVMTAGYIVVNVGTRRYVYVIRGDDAEEYADACMRESILLAEAENEMAVI